MTCVVHLCVCISERVCVCMGIGEKRRKRECECVCTPGPLAPRMTAQVQLRKELGPPWPRTLAARDTGQEGTRGATPAGQSLRVLGEADGGGGSRALPGGPGGAGVPHPRGSPPSRATRTLRMFPARVTETIREELPARCPAQAAPRGRRLCPSSLFTVPAVPTTPAQPRPPCPPLGAGDFGNSLPCATPRSPRVGLAPVSTSGRGGTSPLPGAAEGLVGSGGPGDFQHSPDSPHCGAQDHAQLARWAPPVSSVSGAQDPKELGTEWGHVVCYRASDRCGPPELHPQGACTPAIPNPSPTATQPCWGHSGGGSSLPLRSEGESRAAGSAAGGPRVCQEDTVPGTSCVLSRNLGASPPSPSAPGAQLLSLSSLPGWPGQLTTHTYGSAVP